MFGRLLLLFTLIPIVELVLLLEIGDQIGFWPTVALIIVTGVAGASLAKWQGAIIISEIKNSLNKGQIPGDSLIDGLLVLIAGAVLLTPGILTDFTGFCLLIPPVRVPLRKYLRKRFKLSVQQRGGFHTVAHDIEYDPRHDPENPRFEPEREIRASSEN